MQDASFAFTLLFTAADIPKIKPLFNYKREPKRKECKKIKEK